MADYCYEEVIAMSATKSNVNVKIDSEVKENAVMLLNRMGIDQTTAIDMFYRQIIAERRLPFQPVVLPTPEEQLIMALANKRPNVVALEADENGNILIDKDKHPDIYDWAVNG
jgi:DNA-damage-inducible protein J